MAVNIDTVYQKVLALANKEQRGYITPQEFNLLADRAQLEIFGNYFHDMKTAYHKPKTDMFFGDEMAILKEKVMPFEAVGSAIGPGGFFFSDEAAVAAGATTTESADIPDMYLLDSIRIVETVDPLVLHEVTEIDKRDWLHIENNPLTKATPTRPTFVRHKDRLTILPITTSDRIYHIYYFRIPTTPSWGYVIVNEKALYNSNTSVNFELHESEEENLVSRILQLSGIVIMKPEIVEIGGLEKASTKQEQND